MDKEIEKIINFLNYNITMEHSAIIQYLFHGYTIEDEGIEGQLEEIAREEMKHLRMFAHMVVELGGIPAIDKRAKVNLQAPNPVELIQFNIDAESIAIEEYSNQINKIQDKKIQKILERALQDETAHLKIFKDLQEKVRENLSDKEEKPIIDENKLKILNLLNKHLQNQYKQILETLYQSFITKHKNPYLSDELEQKAIDKMKHFGWVAEELTEKGISPDVNLPKVDKTQNIEEIVSYQQQQEKQTTEELFRISENIEDKDLKWILERIEKREIHYTDLKQFLDKPDIKEEEISMIIGRFTVGSLFRKGKMED